EEGQDGQAQQQGAHRIEAADGADDADVAAGHRVLHAAQQGAGEPQEREGEGQQAEGDVDQEGPAPAVLGPAESDEEAAQGGADGHGYAHDGAEPAEGPAAFLAAEVLLDHAHALRVEQASAESVEEAGDVESFRGGCEARGDGGDRVDAEADEVDTAAAEQVAGTSRGDEDDAEGQGVASQDPLDVGFGRTQALLDGGQSHVDDG